MKFYFKKFRLLNLKIDVEIWKYFSKLAYFGDFCRRTVYQTKHKPSRKLINKYKLVPNFSPLATIVQEIPI